MIDYAREGIGFIAGMDLDSFRQDLKTQRAVTRDIEVIGETVRRLPRAFRDSHPTIPWDDVVGMRDVLAHGYVVIDVEQLWRTACEDFPAIIAAASTILKEIGGTPPRHP